MNYPIDISNKVIKTERLILRPFKLSDLDNFYEYAKNPDVGPNAGWPPHKSKDDSLVILKKFIEHKKTFAITLNSKVIGSIGIELYKEDELKELDNLKAREIGYVLSKDYWGMGIMTEAVKAVIDYLFNKVGLDVIVCGHFVQNDRSRRVQEKCGFKHYKLIKYENIMGTTQESWQSLLYKEKAM